MPKRVSLGLDQLLAQSESSPVSLDRTITGSELDQTIYESDSEDQHQTAASTSSSSGSNHQFKVPANPSPSKRFKFRRLKLDLDDENGDDDSDDEVENVLNYRNTFGAKSQAMLASQRMSQLSQVRSQTGRFSYFPREDCLRRLVADRCIDSENLSTLKLNPSFFRSVRNSFHCHLNLLIETVNNNEYHFQRPNGVCVEFLRYYLRLYSRLTNSKYSSAKDSEQILDQYLGFIGQFFRKTIFNYKWKRSDVMLLLFDPKNEAQNQDFLFNLIEFIIKKFCRSLTTDQSNLEKTQSTLFESNFSLKLPLKLLQIIVDYLCQDFGHFLLNSDNYSLDISNLVGEFKPNCVRLVWHDRRPEYLCSTLKYFISYLVKSFRFNLSPLYTELIRLYCLLAECLRIGIGNIRPYCEVNSSRIQIVPEFYSQLEKHSLIDPPGVLQTIVTLLEPYPWLASQFALHCLSKQFINLNQYFSNQQHQKYTLSLRLICDTFLLGDISLYRYFVGDKQHTKRLKQLELVEKQKKEIESKFVNSKDEEDVEEEKESNNEDDGLGRKSKRIKERKRNKVSWDEAGISKRRPMNGRGSGGGGGGQDCGNQLFSACRRDQPGSITAKMLERYNPNWTDSDGFTSLCIAAKFGHTNCIRRLIHISKHSDDNSEHGLIQLDFESGNKLDGNTPLHYTIESDDLKATELLLQNGGRHLLQLERFDDFKTPKDLVRSVAMKELIETIEYCNSVGQNLLPSMIMTTDYDKDNELSMEHQISNPIEEFKAQCQTHDGRSTLETIVEMNNEFETFIDSSKARFYCDLVAHLIRHYIYTMRLVPFLVLARQLVPELKSQDNSTLRPENLTESFEDRYCLDSAQIKLVRQSYSRLFTKIFQRNGTESDVDHLLDDTLLVHQLSYFFEQFLLKFDIDPNIHNYKIENPKRLGTIISRQFHWILKEFGSR